MRGGDPAPGGWGRAGQVTGPRHQGGRGRGRGDAPDLAPAPPPPQPRPLRAAADTADIQLRPARGQVAGPAGPAAAAGPAGARRDGYYRPRADAAAGRPPQARAGAADQDR